MLDLPGEFAVEKTTTLLQILRRKWAMPAAKFYALVPHLAWDYCEKAQQLCDEAVLQVMGAPPLEQLDTWSLRQVRLLPKHGGWGLGSLWAAVQRSALRCFKAFGATSQTL